MWRSTARIVVRLGLSLTPATRRAISASGVNGQIVIDAGKRTGVLARRALRRGRAGT
jgi:hypothetical protein